MADTKKPVEGLLIRPDRTWEKIQIVPELDPMKTAIGGGWLELTSVRDASIYLDEDGKAKGLPINTLARGFARRLGWAGADGDLFAGTVLILGPVDEEGADTAVTNHTLIQWDRFRADHGVPDNPKAIP